MSQIKKLKDQTQKNANAKNPIEFKAMLGRADGTVQAGKETVYVTLYNGQVITVFNERVPRVPFRKIVIGYDNHDPSLLQVLRFDNVYSTRPQPNLPNHKDSHAWFGYDPIEVYAQQFMPLLPRAIGAMVVRVYGGAYYCNGADCTLDTIDVDMSAEIPGSGAEWVSAEVNQFGAVTFTHGINKPSRELLLPADRPARTVSKKLLYSARMYLGMTRFIQTRTDSDLYDPRFSGYASGGEATSIEWNDILNIPATFAPDLSVTDAVYPRKWFKSAAPTPDDDLTSGYAKSDIWIDQFNGDAYICINNADGAADWTKVSSSGAGGIMSFAVDGRLAVIDNAAMPIVITAPTSISAWVMYLEELGTSGSTILDVVLRRVGSADTSIFTTLPEIAFDDADHLITVTPTITDFLAGDVLLLNIEQIAPLAENVILAAVSSGSGSGGLGLVVTDGTTTVSNVGQITIDGGKVIDNGGGQITIKNIRDYILVRDEKPAGTMGGAFPSGVWNIRTLTVVSSDAGGHCSLSSNQMTLSAGSYEFAITVPAMNTETHQAALYNVTDGIYVYGTSAMSRDIDTAVSFVDGFFTISAPKVFEVRNYSPSGTTHAYGMGHAAGTGQIEVYSVIKFWKVN